MASLQSAGNKAETWSVFQTEDPGEAQLVLIMGNMEGGLCSASNSFQKNKFSQIAHRLSPFQVK